MEVLTKCDKRVLDSLNKNVCLLCKELKDFKTNFQSMVLEQKKAAERLWVLVVRYQVLSRGTKDESIYTKEIVEEMKAEVVLDIQNRTTSIWEIIQKSCQSLEKLQRIYKTVEKESSKLNWREEKNPFVAGSTTQLSLNTILESSHDILFQFSIALTCIEQYFNVLSIKNPETYELLMNSIIISEDLLDSVDEFLGLNNSFLKIK